MSVEMNCDRSHRLVLFDLDDTLYPETAYVLSGFRAVASYIGATFAVPADHTYQRLCTAFEQGIRGSTFNHVLEELTLPSSPDVIQELVRVYRSHFPAIALYCDAARTLPALQPWYQLGLLTDGDAQGQRLKVEALGITQWIDILLFTDDFGRQHWKPSILVFEQALRLADVEAQDAIYVGDNPSKDFIGARALGITTVRIVRPQSIHGHLQPQPGYEADYEITTLDDLPAICARAFQGV
jgi:putative hydrolase of the HAD superfamily